MCWYVCKCRRELAACSGCLARNLNECERDHNAFLGCSISAVISIKNGNHAQKVGGENGFCHSSEHNVLNEVQEVCHNGTGDNHVDHDLN